MKMYPVAERLTRKEARSLGLDKFPVYLPSGCQHRAIKAVWTGEKRCPKAGEWFLSGNPVEAYRAPNDLTIEYNIARLVRVQTITFEVISDA